MQVLTGSNGPHYFPGDSGAGGSVFRAQTRFHGQQHDQQNETEQTQYHVTYPGFWDLVEGVVDLQEELVGNALKTQNILDTETTELPSDETTNTEKSCRSGLSLLLLFR